MNENLYNIKETILRNVKPVYQTTNGKELRVRCPYCGDSRKDASSAHLYIEMKAPFRFHCFKCETSGKLNQQTLRDLSVYDTSIVSSIVDENNTFRENQGIQKVSISKRQKLENNPVNTLSTINSVAYFNNRYGVDLNAEYINSKFKAVLDIPYFLGQNNLLGIPLDTRFNCAEAIGFISTDNSHIVLRDTTNQQQRRYYNMNISNDDDGISSKIYNIPTSINIMNEKINLVITEGIFDIIGVYLHFYKDTTAEKDTIFAAACGKGYNAVILHYIRSGFLDLNLTIYSDSDVDINFYRNLKSNSPYLKNSKITVFYNTISKDYGIPKDQINLKKIII